MATLIKEPETWILGDAFNAKADYFGSMKILWEKKWKYVSSLHHLSFPSHIQPKSVTY
jgi:hypothetical protein